jgi:CHAT domain-containing protein
LPAVLLSAAVIGGLVASGLLWAADRRREGVELRRLATAVGSHRTMHARLTGGFSFGQCESAPTPNDSLVVGLLCPARPASSRERDELAQLATAMRSRTDRGTSPAARHASGVWNIVWNNPGAAIQELQAAAQIEPSNARVQSDLGVALLQRAQVGQDPLFILEALIAIDSALALDPVSREARFNRALTLERLFLDKPATEAWSAYLEIDGRSEWANEARQHRRALVEGRADWGASQRELRQAMATGNDSVLRTISRQYPGRVRSEAQRAASTWARGHLDAPTASDSALQQALRLARALGLATSDALWADIMQSIADARVEADRTVLDAGARGILAYDRGDGYLLTLDLDSASVLLATAHRELVRARNPGVHLVAYSQALVPIQRQTPQGNEEALTALRQLSREVPDSYRVLRGLIARTEGLVEGIRGNIDAAIAAYSASAESGRRTHDPSLELRSYGNLTMLFAKARGERAAWEELYKGFRASSRYADTRADVQRFFTLAADNSWRTNPRLAALFQSEAVRLASETMPTQSDTMRVIRALIREAELSARSGLSDRAFRAVRAARAYTSGIQRESVRAMYAADLDLVQGELWLGVNADSAVRVLRDVVQRYRNTDNQLELDRAYLLLASANSAIGQVDSAQRVFQAALAEIDRRRSRFRDPEQRARFLDQARPLIDRFVAFLADRGDNVGALDFMESMRARVLLETLETERRVTDSAVTTVSAVRRSLPDRTYLISYALVGNELMTWLVNRDTIVTYRSPRAARVEYLVGRFSALIASRSTGQEIREVAAELHSLLIAPFAARVKLDSRLVFIPDKSLHFVPFAALFDAAARRFVAQSFEVSSAPSIALYGQSAARYERLRSRTAPSVLAVGNPRFDSRAFALPPLPGAEREAARVAAYYGPRANVLLNANATRRAFLELGKAADVIHFAGHAVVMPEAPLQSYLVLAQDSSAASSGALYAHELFDMQLPRTQLVILSGCETASGRVSETEGVSSLARALFAAGVPAVIASLWAVDDEMTAEFFSRYHAELARGVDPTSALAHTQRRWLVDEVSAWQHIADWAAFELFGGTRSNPETSSTSLAP